MEKFKDLYFRRLEVLNYSVETIASHRWRLKPFLDYLQSEGIEDPKAITAATVRNYQTFLFGQLNAQGRQNQVTYRNNLLIVAKKFIGFLFEEEVISNDPGQGVDFAIEPKKLPRNILTELEMKKLLDTPDKTTALGYRDKTILEVFYSSGIRRAELLNLKLTDVDFEAGVLRINVGKGGKDRMVPIGKMASRYLKNYIQTVRPLLAKDPAVTYVFLSRLGKQICKCMLGLRLKAYAKQAGIEKDISAHTLRATCATHCIRGKKRKEQMHPRYLMELLGHNSLEALNPYLSVSIVDLKEAHNRCHPRERGKRAG
jgi:integrase/recombinase XerD